MALESTARPGAVSIGATYGILPCKCKNMYQDILYGKGKRLHNRMFQRDPKKHDYRCTVCGEVHGG